MTTYFGSIADDFTGATDLACLLARSGVPVSLRIGVPNTPPVETAPLEIIALKCRTVPVDRAVKEARAALEWLRQAGAKKFFWKYCSTFDSTPRGNIGPVAEALMGALGADQTIYCPAFPENGRSIFMGNLFVGEQPLAESPMKDHPLTPMTDSNLLRLLKPQVKSPVGLANRHIVAKGSQALRERLAQLREEGAVHVIVDALEHNDLRVIAEACQDMPLLTGGSAIAMPLPDIWISQGLVAPSGPDLSYHVEDGPAIILSGSCSAMTNRQVSAYLSTGEPSFRLSPFGLSENGVEEVFEWLSTQASDRTPIIYATAAPHEVRSAQEKLGTERAGAIIEATLAACAVKARYLGFRRFVVAGGETSGAVTNALGIKQFKIGREVAPGVPWCFAQSEGHPVAVTLKSGNFGAENFFTRALEVLDT
jgi:uncharacterized protein YgbK (DUF1537 family)